MLKLRPMNVEDLFHFNSINLDIWTENFELEMYLMYLTTWPNLCIVSETSNAEIAGYMIAKVEGVGKNWHGHITALSIAPQYRRSGLARRLMNAIEDICNKNLSCYFVDLFVRKTNKMAIDFYKRLGYLVWRVLPGYYSKVEDAYEMRKPLSMDPQWLCLKEPIGEGKPYKEKSKDINVLRESLDQFLVQQNNAEDWLENSKLNTGENQTNSKNKLVSKKKKKR